MADKRITIPERANLATVSGWFGDPLTFRLTRDSSFGLLAEGVALGKLRELTKLGTRIRAECTFSLKDAVGEASVETHSEILTGLFGIALALAAESIKDASGQEIRSTLLDQLWRRVTDCGGKIGDGKRFILVSRDPSYPIPQCMSGTTNRFPDRDEFRSTMSEIARAFGQDTAAASPSEEEILTFIYESLRNVHEHARADLQGRAISGVRGVIFDKVITPNPREVARRRDLPGVVKRYMNRVLGDTRRISLFFAYTVVDLGPGIHRTLPGRANERDAERLDRAFRYGESRKPTGSDISLGQGLPHLIEASEALRAFLFVRSADIVAFFDFAQEKVESIHQFRLRVWEEDLQVGAEGSALTLLWPLVEGGGDQQSLFSEGLGLK